MFHRICKDFLNQITLCMYSNYNLVIMPEQPNHIRLSIWMKKFPVMLFWLIRISTVGPWATLSLGPKILQRSSNQRCSRLMLFSSGIFLPKQRTSKDFLNFPWATLIFGALNECCSRKNQHCSRKFSLFKKIWTMLTFSWATLI